MPTDPAGYAPPRLPLIGGAPLPISLVASVDRAGGIGKAGALLARIPDDLRRLKAMTMGAAIVMGRKTWDSIGRPLPGRRNIVVTRSAGWQAAGAEVAASIEHALALALAADTPRAFVLGGAEIYALALPWADRLELTEIDAEFAADTRFPHWDRAVFRQTGHEPHRTEGGLGYAFVTYERLGAATADPLEHKES